MKTQKGNVNNYIEDPVQTPWNNKVKEFLEQIRIFNGKVIRVGIIGALGCGDIGDEAMLVAMVEKLKTWHTEMKCTVFSVNPKLTKSYVNVDCVPTLHYNERIGDISLHLIVHLLARMEDIIVKLVGNIFGGAQSYKIRAIWQLFFLLQKKYLIACIKNYKKSGTISSFFWNDHLRNLSNIDVLIVIGGGYFNSWHWGSLMHPFLTTIELMTLLSKPVIISGINLGPLNEKDRTLIKETFKKVQLIGLRDWRESVQELKKIGLFDKTKVFFSTDDAFSLKPDLEENEKLKRLLTKHKKFVFVQTHPFLLTHNQSNILVDRLSEVIDELVKKNDIHLIMCPFLFGRRTSADLRTLRKIFAKLKFKNQVTLLKYTFSPRQLKYIVSKATCTICTRLHPFVFSLSTGVPAAAVALDEYYQMKLNGVTRGTKTLFKIYNFKDNWVSNLIEFVEMTINLKE